MASGPESPEYSGVTYELLGSYIEETYDLADQRPRDREFVHFWS